MALPMVADHHPVACERCTALLGASWVMSPGGIRSWVCAVCRPALVLRGWRELCR